MWHTSIHTLFGINGVEGETGLRIYQQMRILLNRSGTRKPSQKKRYQLDQIEGTRLNIFGNTGIECSEDQNQRDNEQCPKYEHHFATMPHRVTLAVAAVGIVSASGIDIS